MSIQRNLNYLKILRSITPKKNQSFADDVIMMYQNREIKNIRTCEKLIESLKTRGRGPQTAIKKINNHKTKTILAMDTIELSTKL